MSCPNPAPRRQRRRERSDTKPTYPTTPPTPAACVVPDLPDCLMSMSHSHDTRVGVDVNHTCSAPEYVTLQAPFQLTAHSALAPPVRTHVTLPAAAVVPYWRPSAVRA